jgi:predicted dehydrogenase
MDYLISAKPDVVIATGQKHLNSHEDVAYLTIYFENSVIAHINVNWLSPVKVRTTLLGGEKKMLVWNDLEADEKIKIYDKGIDIKSGDGVYDLLVSYRSGDMWSPKIEQTEALANESRYFIDCINKQETPFNDGAAGLRVVRLLEAAGQSLKERGKAISV